MRLRMVLSTAILTRCISCCKHPFIPLAPFLETKRCGSKRTVLDYWIAPRALLLVLGLSLSFLRREIVLFVAVSGPSIHSI